MKSKTYLSEGFAGVPTINNERNIFFVLKKMFIQVIF